MTPYLGNACYSSPKKLDSDFLDTAEFKCLQIYLFLL